MDHFDSSEWVDFVRGIPTESRVGLMQRHLDVGCAQCAEQLQLWKAFVKFANEEPYYTPPASAVRIAKAALQTRPGRTAQSALRAVAKLVFDSFQQPQLAGVRSTSPAKRYLLYKYDSLIIDLAVEPGPNPRESLVIGQITDCKPRDLRGLSISLVRGEQRLLQTRANGFGEFFLEYQQAPDTWITFALNEKKELVIPIGEVA